MLHWTSKYIDNGNSGLEAKQWISSNCPGNGRRRTQGLLLVVPQLHPVNRQPMEGTMTTCSVTMNRRPRAARPTAPRPRHRTRRNRRMRPWARRLDCLLTWNTLRRWNGPIRRICSLADTPTRPRVLLSIATPTLAGASPMVPDQSAAWPCPASSSPVRRNADPTARPAICAATNASSARSGRSCRCSTPDRRAVDCASWSP